MFHTLLTKRSTVVSIVALALLVLPLAGCGGSPKTATSEDPSTAMGGLPVAEPAVLELADDAVLLLVKTGTVVGPESKPTWVYVFGSEKTGKLYTASLADGKLMDASETGDAPLVESEWDSVPSTEAWAVDSPEAYEKAFEASGATEADVSHEMLIQTYIPQHASGTAEAEPFVWYVSMTWEDSGAVIAIDAETGETEKKK